MLKAIWLAITRRDEIEEFLRKEQIAREEAERKDRIHNLKLCVKHKQERNQSHYSEHNCDHCKLQAEVERLKVAELYANAAARHRAKKEPSHESS